MSEIPQNKVAVSLFDDMKKTQAKLFELTRKHVAIVSAAQNASKLCPRREVFDESKDREFLDAMDKLAELVK